MIKISFLPLDDAGKVLWAKNFASKLPQYAAKYSVSAEEVADVQKGAAYFSFLADKRNQMEEYQRMYTQFKNLVREGSGNQLAIPPAFPDLGPVPEPVMPGVFNRMRSLALRIKKHFDYRDADGMDLGISSPEVSRADLDTAKPVLTLKLVKNGNPQIGWVKKSMSAIMLYVDRGAGAGYEYLAIDTNPDYIDTFPIEKGTAAVWKYKGIYMFKDERVGLFSDDVSITVTGRD